MTLRFVLTKLYVGGILLTIERFMIYFINQVVDTYF